MKKARVIALYLPQFHPIPENDEWWGKGFTEWTNTAKARPLFGGHYQPHLPADLGFYDLRVPETRVQQAQMAESAGIEGFCYYHYWFAGRRILNRPFDEVVASGKPNFPFCVCWANQTWSGVWHGLKQKNTILIEQTYPGESDHRAHFEVLLPAFQDVRYMKVEGKPLFMIYGPQDIPNPKATLSFWRAMAKEAGLEGIYFVGHWSANDPEDLREIGFDATVQVPNIRLQQWLETWRRPFARVKQSIDLRRGIPNRFDMSAFFERNKPRRQKWPSFPCVVHAWDNTPRSGSLGIVGENSTPQLFAKMLQSALATVAHEPEDRRLVFLKSWNEWAEGNHLEPDLRYGSEYLNALREALRPTAS